MTKTYSLMRRRVKRANGNEGTFQHTITVPAAIARAVADAKITAFTVELTEDGILYRPEITGAEAPTLPSWLDPARRGRI